MYTVCQIFFLKTATKFKSTLLSFPWKADIIDSSITATVKLNQEKNKTKSLFLH